MSAQFAGSNVARIEHVAEELLKRPSSEGERSLQMSRSKDQEMAPSFGIRLPMAVAFGGRIPLAAGFGGRFPVAAGFGGRFPVAAGFGGRIPMALAA